MTKKNLTVVVLCGSALILAAVNLFFPPAPASAATTVIGKGYQVCTSLLADGSEGAFILNNQTGTITCFSYDPSTRRIVSRASVSVPDLFAVPQLPPK
ncbi:MAG TPA: hypothetical protein VGG19_17360 [Tepidisphaeraceae bacterium]|jgi:hypothetical protein